MRLGVIWCALALLLVCGCDREPQRANSNPINSGQSVSPPPVTDEPTTDPSTDAPLEQDQESQRLLFDFDRTTLSANWTATGKIRVSQKALPTSLDFDGRHPSLQGLAIRTEGESSVQCKSEKIPADWRGQRELSFWVYRSAQESEKHETSTIDIHLYEADGKTRFTSRVDLAHIGWAKITLPLRWFRWGSDRIAQWDRIDRLQFWFRDPADISLDTIWLTAGDNPQSAYLDSQDLRQVAFPSDGGRLLESQSAVVITDAVELDIELLCDHLDRVAEAIRGDFPFFQSFSIPPTLIIFSTREDFQAFVPRFGKQFNAVARPPQSGGYSLLGVSLSYWDKTTGSLRPVYAHEYIHGVISRGAMLPSRGEWFHEGTATLYQLRFHPQENLRELVQKGMSESRLRHPLDQLCSGKRIPTNRYWQAMTVVEALLDHPRHSEQLQELIGAFRRSGSTDLGPHLKTVLSTDWETLTADWQNYCKQKYGAVTEAAQGVTSP